MRPIDADFLCGLVNEKLEEDWEFLPKKFLFGVRDLLDSTPTIDAVEVVRCRDCKYRPIDYGDEHDLCFPKEYHCPCQCDDNWYSWMPKDDFFCARGERKPNAKGCEKNGHEYTDKK